MKKTKIATCTAGLLTGYDCRIYPSIGRSGVLIQIGSGRTCYVFLT